MLFRFVVLLICLISTISCTNGAQSNESAQKSEPFVEFSLPGLDGEIHKLSEYRGKKLLINFWASWCVPCIAELPSLQQLSKKYEDRGLQVVAISVDSVKAIEEVRKLKHELNLEFDILFDHEMEIPPKLGITGFPETFFADTEGMMITFLDPKTNKDVVRVIGDRDWSSESIQRSIEELLNR